MPIFVVNPELLYKNPEIYAVETPGSVSLDPENGVPISKSVIDDPSVDAAFANETDPPRIAFGNAIGRGANQAYPSPLAMAGVKINPHCSIKYPVGLFGSGYFFQPFPVSDEENCPCVTYWLLEVAGSPKACP